MRTISLTFLLLLLVTAARADVIIANYNTAVSYYTEVVRFDAAGNQIDATDQAQIIQTGTCPGVTCTFYWNGTAHGCAQNPAYMLLNYGNWCGFYSRTSTDLKNWSAPGPLIVSPALNSNCNVTLTTGGCWALSMIYNAGNNNWVGWFHAAANSPYTVGVMTCTTPAGPCTVQSNPTGVNAAVADIGSIRMLLDGTTGYIIFNTPSGAGSRVYVQQLNAAFTDAIGSATQVNTSGNMESPSLFKNGSTYYALFGGNCAYCNGSAVSTDYWTASTPLGAWTHQTTVTADACGGAAAGVDLLTISGTPVYLFHSDQWYGNLVSGPANQGLTNQYFDQLTFTGSTLNALTCAVSTTIVGLTETPNPPPPSDQSDVAAYFQSFCDVTTTKRRLQTFVPSKPFIRNIYPTVSQNMPSGASGDCDYPATGCAQINGSLVIDLVNVDGSNNPTTTIASSTFTTGQVPWTSTTLAVPINQNVTPGTPYGIVWRGTNTNFCYGMAYSDGLPYASGVEKQSTDSGATWALETNRSLRFYTDTVPPGGLLYSGTIH